MKSRFLALLIAASIAGTATAGPPCTSAEQKTSQQHYDNQGNLRPGSGKVVPKYCPRRAAAGYRHSSCRKSGYRQAATFFEENYASLNQALTANDQIYAARREIFAPALEPHIKSLVRRDSSVRRGFGQPAIVLHPFEGHAFARAAAGGRQIALVDQIRLPPKGTGVMDAYYDTSSGMVFGLKYIPNPHSENRDLLLLVFKGSDAFTEANDFVRDNKEQFHRGFPAKYLAATQVAQQLQTLLIKNGLGCSTTVLYTGHSLGGGLALAAAQLSGLRCRSKRDALVLFNFETPNTENREMYVRQSNSLNLIVDMATELDVVSSLSLRKRSIMRLLAENAQVVRFANIPSSTSDRISSHFLVRFREQFNILNQETIPSKRFDELLCTWYEPI